MYAALALIVKCSLDHGLDPITELIDNTAACVLWTLNDRSSATY